MADNWTTTLAAAGEADDTSAARTSARQLAAAIGGLDLDEIRSHHLELTLAVSELAANAGTPWPWTADDPTVALVRALARLAIVAPDTTADSAGRLVTQLTA